MNPYVVNISIRHVVCNAELRGNTQQTLGILESFDIGNLEPNSEELVHLFAQASVSFCGQKPMDSRQRLCHAVEAMLNELLSQTS